MQTAKNKSNLFVQTYKITSLIGVVGGVDLRNFEKRYCNGGCEGKEKRLSINVMVELVGKFVSHGCTAWHSGTTCVLRRSVDQWWMRGGKFLLVGRKKVTDSKTGRP